MRKNDISGIFPSFCISYPSVSENMTLWGSWGWTLYNWGKSWWITSCYCGTDITHMSPLFLLNFPSFLAIYPESLVAVHQKTQRRSWVHQEGHGVFLDEGCLDVVMWVSAVSGNWLEGIRGFLVQMILSEPSRVQGKRRSQAWRMGAPIIGFYSSLVILGWRWFLLSCFISIS